MSGVVPAPSFLRVESVQVAAQALPSIVAAVPQTLPSAAVQQQAMQQATNGGAAATPASAGGAVAAAPPAPSLLSPLCPVSALPAQLLAWHTEQRVRQLVSAALNFQRHAHAQVLTTDHINLALRHKNAAPIYGYDNASSVLPPGGNPGASVDENSALQFTQAGEDLFLVADRVVHFDDLLQQPLPKVPADPTFSMHWLAIDGVQPLIPQNPHPTETDAAARAATAGGQATAAAQTTSTGVTTRIVLDKSEKEVISKPLVKHVLSKEQQLYYEYVISAMRGEDASLKKAVYDSISKDDGLHQLLPYFTQFIAEELANNLHNLQLLSALMKLANCLLHSKYLHIEPYLHQLMPSILTCIVGKQLCVEPYEDHWSLRSYTAVILQWVCMNYAATYPDLQPRVTQMLLQALLNPQQSLTTHYGCITALAHLGHKVVRALVIPYVPAYFEVLTAALSSSNDTTRMEASYVFNALLSCVGQYIKRELETATSPAEMAAAVRAAMQAPVGQARAAHAAAVKAEAASAQAAKAAGAGASSMDDDVQVKTEPSDSAAAAAAAASKKRRRSPEQVTLPPPSGLPGSSGSAVAASASSSSISAAGASLLPDPSSLEGIQLLMDLFGETLQPHLTAALAAFERRVDEAAAAAAAAAAPTTTGNTIKLSRAATKAASSALNVANVFA